MFAKSGKITNQKKFEDFFCCLGNYAYLCSVRDGLTFRDPPLFQHIIIDGMLFCFFLGQFKYSDYFCSAMEWKPSGSAVCRSSIPP